MKQWRGPEYEGEFPSLGWGVIDVIEEYLSVPSGLSYGERLVLTNRQKAFTVRQHRIHPVTGRYQYRRSVKEGPKGDGKSPHLGATAFGHLVGPVVFDGWDAYGEPIGRPHPTPWIQIAALAEDQTDNCYKQLRAALVDSKAIDDFGIDIGLTRIYLIGKPGVMEPVTSSNARVGQPITFAGKEEIWLWKPERHGPELSMQLEANLMKTGGISMAATNTFRRGEGSVAEIESDAAEEGVAGLLYEAHRGSMVTDLTDTAAVRKSLEQAYDPEAHWVPLDTIATSAPDPTTPPNVFRQLYFNIPFEFTDESWLPDGEWESHRRKGRTVNRDQPFVGTIDMALKHDTAAIRLGQFGRDGRIVVESKIWIPIGDGTVLDVEPIEAFIIQLAATGNLVRFGYDPAFFERSAQALADRGVPMEEFPQSRERMVPACGNAYELICGGQVIHDDDEISSAQVTNAAAIPSGEGWRLSKGKTKRKKIDSAISLVMTLELLTQIAPVTLEPAVYSWDDVLAELAAEEADDD